MKIVQEGTTAPGATALSQGSARQRFFSDTVPAVTSYPTISKVPTVPDHIQAPIGRSVMDSNVTNAIASQSGMLKYNLVLNTPAILFI